MLKHQDDQLTCTCGHEGFNHSDVDLNALGKCYICDCEAFNGRK